MRDRLIRLIAVALASGSVAQAGGRPHPDAGPCGVRMRLLPGWKAVDEEPLDDSCRVELRPPGWRYDPDCPERYGGRLLVAMTPKRLQTVGGRREQYWLRAEPVCDSGWAAVAEMSSCLHPIKGHRAALSTQTNFRQYCKGMYTAQEVGRFGVVFGEGHLAFVESDVDDDGLFDQVLASLHP